MRNALIYLLLLVSCVAVAAQEISDTTLVRPGEVIPVKGAMLEQLQPRDSILVADQLRYGFTLEKVEEGTQFIFPELPEKQDYKLMYLTPWMMDTLKVTKQKKGLPKLYDLRGSVVISSFEEGLYELPQIVIGRVSKDGVLDTLVFEPMRMEVKTMPVDTATFTPHDIKSQIRYPLTFAEVFPWAFGGWILALLIIMVVCLVMIRRRKGGPTSVNNDPAHIVALRKLDSYRGNQMWAPEKQKAFYSGVTDTLREYIDSRYGISAMEMTTAEIFDDMKSTDVPENLRNEMKELFDRADFVKFAKYVATDDDNASVLPVAVRFITETYQAELETPAAAEEEKEADHVL